jgi:hypothetical protein
LIAAKTESLGARRVPFREVYSLPEVFLPTHRCASLPILIRARDERAKNGIKIAKVTRTCRFLELEINP